MGVQNFEELRSHVGHRIVCVTYGTEQNVAVECVDCSTVLLDFDRDAAPDSRRVRLIADCYGGLQSGDKGTTIEVRESESWVAFDRDGSERLVIHNNLEFLPDWPEHCRVCHLQKSTAVFVGRCGYRGADQECPYGLPR